MLLGGKYAHLFGTIIQTESCRIIPLIDCLEH